MTAPDEIAKAARVFDELGVRTRSSRQPRETVSKPVVPFPFTLARDIKVEPKAFLIDGFLGLHEQSAWYGPPESGKSTIIVHANCCVAADVPFCGRKVRQSPVLFVAAERGAIVRRRVKAWCQEHNLPDIPLAVMDNTVNFLNGDLDAARIIATANKLSGLCGKQVGLITFDTLSRILAGGDENSAKDMGQLIANVDKVFRETGAHCSLTHHVPVSSNDRMRGHSSLLGAVDTTVRVSKTNSIVSAEIDKANDLVDRPSFAFTFKTVVLDADTNTTAPVAVQVDAPTAGRPAARLPRMPKSARITLRAVREAIRECGKPAPASNYIPASVRVTDVETCRRYAYAAGISAADATDRAKQKAFKGAIEYLIAESLVGVHQQIVWDASRGALS